MTSVVTISHTKWWSIANPIVSCYDRFMFTISKIKLLLIDMMRTSLVGIEQG